LIRGIIRRIGLGRGISPKRRGGIALQETMQQSQHRSVQQAASHYNEVDRAKGRAVRLGI
jgi:hypothetical protein